MINLPRKQLKKILGYTLPHPLKEVNKLDRMLLTYIPTDEVLYFDGIVEGKVEKMVRISRLASERVSEEILRKTPVLGFLYDCINAGF